MTRLRLLASLSLATTLFGCAASAPSPEPLADDQVRITFNTQPMDNLRAHRLNGELVRASHFADLPAGAHNLDMRFRFEMPGGRGGPGLREPQRRTCELRIDYADFNAGESYVIRAERLNWRPRGWLMDSEGNRLVQGEVVRCLPV